MESVNTLLGIFASILSIIATFTSWKNKSEVKKLRDSYDHSNLFARGDNNMQVNGSGNKVYR